MTEDNKSPRLPGFRRNDIGSIPAPKSDSKNLEETQAISSVDETDPKPLFADDGVTEPAAQSDTKIIATPAPVADERDPRVTLRDRWTNRRAALAARRSSVRLTRVSPWGAGLMALFCSVVLACAVEGLVYLTWKLFDSAGIFDKLVDTLVPTGGDGAEKLESWLTLDKFLTIGGVAACSLLVLVPVFCFFAAITFNLVAKITGGVRITLTGDK